MAQPRITGEKLDGLKAAIEPLDTPERRTMWRERQFPRAEHVKDLDVSYRWGLFHAVRGWQYLGDDEGITDAHIRTALKAIVPAL